MISNDTQHTIKLALQKALSEADKTPDNEVQEDKRDFEILIGSRPRQSPEPFTYPTATPKPIYTKVIVLEGLDGAGKTTALQTLYGYISSCGLTSHVITATTVGEASAVVRDAFVSDAAKDLSDDSLAMLVSAYNTSIIENEIFPRMGKVDYIIVDRLYHTTAAYQWRSIIADALVEHEHELLPIDLVIYLDIDYPTSLKRKEASNGKLDHFEKTDRYTFNSRAKAYRNAFRVYPAKQLVVIDATSPITDVNDSLYKAIDGLEMTNYD